MKLKQVQLLPMLLALLLMSSTAVAHGEDQPRELCLDLATAYDRNFKWYNTMGPQPVYNGDHYLFTGSRATNVYQDALATTSIEAGRTFALSTRISIYMENRSPSDRDEFAVFVTDDTKVFTGDEFGFVIRQKSSTINGYIQSPRIPEFFREFRLDDIPLGVEKTYTLKAVYSEVDDETIIRFFVNDVNVLTYGYPKVTGENFYLVISSKKLSPENVDTSGNYVKVFSACIVNLPPQRADNTTQTSPQQSSTPEQKYILIMLIAQSVLLTLLVILSLILVKSCKT
ncbi:hypothetical protein CSUB_C0403 [Candidatus Caldarchaeum subterraneum]|uniref:DUF1080 domain-containing protein n=1 Tax=Caldiarchaeum subterraneum TaxID=311458 RepID=E6N537_CALS0|nr:hypothetical protein HGMM_F29F08C15 [Candidatus Caldarchaeum subterraneum]BAJ49253.1 hypothetical protein HGMM_F07G12C21 [Candidatus Caldarchaeum subterraneum]BAJ50264.1 hypothetical protein CSUB_C0403 [Candidatus Caldarchaeum subterraneum]GBC72201.1 hypothetical protein HRbin03_00026 [archaeon HR03]